MMDALRAATLCRLGWHCRRRRTIVKFDGGRGAHLCPHCSVILYRDRP